MEFRIVGRIVDVEIIASVPPAKAQTIVEVVRQRTMEKMKGIATVEFPDGTITHAEVHW